jgi:hypothetical protein
MKPRGEAKRNPHLIEATPARWYVCLDIDPEGSQEIGAAAGA